MSQGSNSKRTPAGSTNSIGVPLTLLADGDGDGMADDWERLNGLSPTDGGDACEDPNHDGMANWQEYVAGTDPRNGQSSLKIVSAFSGAGGVSLEFNADSNRTYAVLSQESLGGGAWLKLVELAARPTNRVETIFDGNAAGRHRFYRLATS